MAHDLYEDYCELAKDIYVMWNIYWEKVDELPDEDFGAHYLRLIAENVIETYVDIEELKEHFKKHGNSVHALIILEHSNYVWTIAEQQGYDTAKGI